MSDKSDLPGLVIACNLASRATSAPAPSLARTASGPTGSGINMHIQANAALILIDQQQGILHP
ncbi:hypothetical protein QNM99_28140, partial [Pseudomonas sp. PCH446]